MKMIDLADSRISVTELLDFAKAYVAEKPEHIRCAMIVLLDRDLVPTCYVSHEGPEMFALMALHAQRIASKNAEGLIFTEDDGGDDDGAS